MTTGEHREHVLVIGVDGTRYDSLLAAHTPNIDRLGAAGFFVPVRVDDRNPTWSGPVWATVATGVYRDRHGVHNNDLTGNRFARYPDFLTRVRTERPDLTTFAAACWAPLTTDAKPSGSFAGGPVFPGGYRPALPLGVEDLEHLSSSEIEETQIMDEAVVARAARELLYRDPAASFVYFRMPDVVGHALGVVPRYTEAIEHCDEQIGVLLAAVDARSTRADEEWTVIVVTDHGHRDTGHHGGDSDAERTAWIAAAGQGIDATSATAGVDHADIHSHVLALFDIPVQPEWELQGSAFGAPGNRSREALPVDAFASGD
jgi:arylsulfatase A-like enzyme